jgi:BolA protein
MEATIERIESILKQDFEPLHLVLTDDSARHAGHAGARDGGGHFHVLIVSSRFEGQALVARHRLVNQALGEMIGAEIHALGLRTLAPAEWSSE